MSGESVNSQRGQGHVEEQEPHTMLPYFNPFDLLLNLLAEYGWLALGATVVGLWLYSILKPKVNKLKDDFDDALHKKDPDLQLKRMEAVEAARQKQQQALEAAAEQYKVKEEEKLAKKRQEYIERNEGKGGNKLGSRADYLPLCGAGSSGGYKAPKKKCPGGGCGR